MSLKKFLERFSMRTHRLHAQKYRRVGGYNNLRSLSLCAHHKGVGRDNWQILKFDDHDENKSGIEQGATWMGTAVD